ILVVTVAVIDRIGSRYRRILCRGATRRIAGTDPRPPAGRAKRFARAWLPGRSGLGRGRRNGRERSRAAREEVEQRLEHDREFRIVLALRLHLIVHLANLLPRL